MIMIGIASTLASTRSYHDMGQRTLECIQEVKDEIGNIEEAEMKTIQ